jgi:hypothetical protein
MDLVNIVTGGSAVNKGGDRTKEASNDVTTIIYRVLSAASE